MSFWYLATPYTSHPQGLEAAFTDAVNNLKILMQQKIPVFSPIAHAHTASIWYDLPKDAGYWREANFRMIRVSYGIIVCTIDGWDKSDGITDEVYFADKSYLPTIYMTPGKRLDQRKLKRWV